MSESTSTATTAIKRPGPDRGSEAAALVSPGRSPATSQDATEMFVRSRIETAQTALWRAELTRRVLTVVIAMMAIGLLWVAMDQWIFSPGRVGRTLAAMGLSIALVAYIYWQLWPVMHLRISEDYAARALERDHPELGHALSSYVSLRRQRSAHPGGQLAQRVVQSVGSSAAAKLRHIDAPPREATGLATWWAVTIALFAAVAIYASASPKNSVQSVARLALPLAALEAPKRVVISDVAPGNAESLAGRNIEIAATVVNLHDDEPVYFVWESNASPADLSDSSPVASEESSRTQVRLLPSDTVDVPDRFLASVPISHHARGTRRYRIVAGDAEAGPFQISIRDTPVVQIREIVYEPPAYTGKSRRTSHVGAIRGVDGTRIRLAANVNRPIRRAVIEFNPRKVGREIQATAGVREMQLATDGTGVEFSFPLRLRGGSAIPLQDYRLRVWDDAGQTNSDPIVYPIEIVEDLPPEISIVVPQQSPVDVALNGFQNFEIHAADVDYGLAEIELEVRRGIDLIARSSLWKQPAGKLGNQVVEYLFQPSRIIIAAGGRSRRGGGLNVGDEVEVVAIATDNRFDPNDESIVAGVTKTHPIRLRITAAAEQTNESEQEPAAGQPQEQGEQGAGQQGEGQQGEGQQGEGQQGEGQQGEGQQGEGQQGEGQQGEGQQGEGQQGEGQQGEGQQERSAQGNRSGSDDSTAAENSDNEAAAEDGQTQDGSTGERGSSAAEQSSQPPQDDAEAFERIQDYLNEQQQPPAEDAQGAGETGDAMNSGQNQSGTEKSDRGEGGRQPNPAQTGGDQAGNNTPRDNASEQPSGRPSDQRETERGDDETPATDPNQADPGDDGQGSSDPSTGGPSAEEQRGDGQRGDGQRGDGQRGDAQRGDGQRDDDARGDTMPDVNQPNDRTADDDTTQQPRPTESGEESGGETSSEVNNQAQRGDDGGPSGEGGSDGGEPAGAGSSATDDGAGRDDASSADDAQGTDAADGSNDAENTPQDDQNQRGDSESGKPGNESGKSGNASEDKPSSPRGGQEPNGSSDGSTSDAKSTESSTTDDAFEPSSSSGNSKPADPTGTSSTLPDADGSDSSQGAGGGQSGGGEGTGDSLENELPDPVDLEYTKAATDMVLDYIDETRTDPDPNLLQRLKWSEADLRRFRDRWQNVKPIDGGPRSEAVAPDEIEEALRSLGMRPREITKTTQGDTADTLGNLRDSGNRRPAPADVRDAFEAFRRGLGQSAGGRNEGRTK